VGCYNSGTTLLDRIVQSHPEVAGLPIEGAFMSDALPVPETFGWTRMWHRCEEEMRLDPNAPKASDRAIRIRRQWAPWTSKQSTLIVEKSIANTCRIDFLETHFQPARFIHVVRNGYAVAEGIRRKARPGVWDNPEYRDSYPISLCARQWCRSLQVASSALTDEVRHLEVAYESLVRSPEATLERIADFLQLSAFPGRLLDRNWSIHGRRSPLSNHNPRSLAALDSEDIETVRDVAAEWLDHYEYEPLTDDA
jgi:hypothetical protein